MPFHTLRDTEISYKVIQGDRPAMPTNASELGISDGLWQLLVRCWNVDYTKRPQINEILQRLSQEPDLGRIFPPLKPPPAPICDCESVFESGTQKYGNGSRSKPVCSPTHPSIGEIFVTAPASADARVSSEGMLGATLWIIGLNTPPVRMSAVPHAHKSCRHRRVLES